MRLTVLNITNGRLSGGYRKYLERLVPLLRGDPRVTSLDLLVPAQARDMVNLEDISVHTWPVGSMASHRAWWKDELRRLAPDVVFVPTARWLPCGRVPVVVMIRNMEPLLVPFAGNSPTEMIRNTARAYGARRACQRASRVIAVSEHVRDYLVRRWRLPSDGIGVVYHGIEPPPGRPETLKPKALEGRGVEEFVFTAGSLRPARGLEDAIKALAIVKAHGVCPTLVIGGEPDPGTEYYKRQMSRLALKCGVESQVLWAGQLNPREMSWCFFNCAAFVMTSRAEACPNVVLEAMSHGCIGVSTRQAPMPEFFMDAAFYYRPGDASDLANQLLWALALSPCGKENRRSAARHRACQFDWQLTARATIANLELALAGS